MQLSFRQHKKIILQINLALFVLAGISFCVEYFGIERGFLSINIPSYFNPYRFFFIFASLILCAFFIGFYQHIGGKPEYAFLTIAIVCGSLLAFSEIHTFVSWDEGIHYQRADGYSLKWLLPKTVTDIYSKGRSVPHSYSIIEQAQLDASFDGQEQKPNKRKKNNFSFSLFETYQKLAYIPSGIALFLGRLFHLPMHFIFILGRFANVLVFSIIVFFAIRIAKTSKLLIATIALIPTSLFLASNYSYDSWLTAFSLLGFALLFSELQEPDTKISLKKALTIVGIFVLALSPKAIYFPFIFLLFLLPKNKFQSKKEYQKFLWATTLALCFTIASFLVPFLVSGQGGDDKRGGKTVDSSQQIRFIFSDPIAYTQILTRFISEYINPLNTQATTVSFAYLGVVDGFGVILFLFILILIFDTDPLKRQINTPRNRLIIIAIFLATVALIATALYISFTPVRNLTINGVQGRYLIPLLFPILFIIGSHRIPNPFNKNVFNTVIFSSITIILLSGIWNLITKLYY